MKGSRIPLFHKLSVRERRAALCREGALSEADIAMLEASGEILPLAAAECMVENVIGRLTLPLGIALNMMVNSREHLVPMAVEEPSIVAGVSAAAKLGRERGGFTSTSAESLLIGQVQLLDIDNIPGAVRRIDEARDSLLGIARESQPRLWARGGGVREIEAHAVCSPRLGVKMLIVHLHVDTVDAMGANLVSSLCEALAPTLAEVTGGKPLLRILSNLSDRALVTSRVCVPSQALATVELSGEEVRDRIVLASEFAAADAHRAATHNKGIMNGVDAVALATGNDWRALEAGAHAYAARNGRYGPLAEWRCGPDGDLEGVLVMPIKVGIVGAQVEAHPCVRLAHRIVNVGSARELAEIMGAIGLAQNLAALRALSTNGISHGHLRLHARAVALAAHTPSELVDTVVEQLIVEREVKVWRATEIVRMLTAA